MRFLTVAICVSFCSPVYSMDICRTLFGRARVERHQNYKLSSTALFKGISQSITDFERYAMDEYSGGLGRKKTIQLLSQLKGLGPPFLQLVVDPGIIQHRDAFISYAQKKHISDPWVARDQFGLYGVPRVSFFRAINSDNPNEIKTRGMLAKSIHYFTVYTAQPEEAKQVLRDERSLRLRDHIDSAMMTLFSPFISMSASPELATAVAAEGSTTGGVHLYKVTLSDLDVIRIEKGIGIFDVKAGQSVWVGSANSPEKLLDKDVEVFAFGYIPPQNLKEIKRPKGAYYRTEGP